MSSKTPVAVAPMDPAKRNSKVSGPIGDEQTVQMNKAKESCYWNDAEFHQGDRVECEGQVYECSFGVWVQLGD